MFASKLDLLLAIARRPRLAELCTEVESARSDSFRPDWRITDQIEFSRRPTAPDPGIVLPDDGPDMDLLESRSAPPYNSLQARPSTWPPARPPARPAAAALQAPPPPTFLPDPSGEAY
ncbi:hypothetical protein [Streptomyces sp. enrichment culture]|uniref:hypothetical protein n=1 Tax=Streptomyces sp. enrichment culture TaxID=1795815 RepID=UPI003F575AC1